MLNPVVDSMRGLCAASHLNREQQNICSRPVSLGSFSEAQGVFDPELRFMGIGASRGFAGVARRHGYCAGILMEYGKSIPVQRENEGEWLGLFWSD